MCKVLILLSLFTFFFFRRFFCNLIISMCKVLILCLAFRFPSPNFCMLLFKISSYVISAMSCYVPKMVTIGTLNILGPSPFHMFTSLISFTIYCFVAKIVTRIAITNNIPRYFSTVCLLREAILLAVFFIDVFQVVCNNLKVSIILLFWWSELVFFNSVFLLGTISNSSLIILGSLLIEDIFQGWWTLLKLQVCSSCHFHFFS